MLRSAVRRAATVAAVAASRSPRESLSSRASPILPPPAAATRTLRFYAAGGLDDPLPQQEQQRQVAQQMVQYAIGLARSQRSADSYSQALLVLEQGLSNLRAGGGEASDDAVGMLLIAMSTLLHERGEVNDAMEKLRMVHQLDHCSLGARVAAWEGLVGLNLEAEQDTASSVLADECLQLLRSRREENTPTYNVLNLRGKAIKGLVDLVIGDLKTAESNFGECEDCESMEGKYRCGNLA